MRSVGKSDVRALFPKKPAWSHKGQWGRLLVVGGSLRYSGSPAFVALGAIRCGTDLTLVAAPKRSADIIASFQPDIITEPLNCEHVCPSDVVLLKKHIRWADATVIGGGLDRKPSTYKAIKSLLRELGRAGKPCVVDAEAIRAIGKEKKLIRDGFIITPHEGEFAALGGKLEQAHDIKKRADEVRRVASELGATVLLKGSTDIISNGSEVAANMTGHPFMTKGGTGDVLAGVCGSLLARNVNPFQAACAASWISGKSGEMAARENGPGFYVSEMLDYIPRAIWK